MSQITLVYIFTAIILTYVTGAVLSLLAYKQCKISNLITVISAGIASFIALLFSIIKICFFNETPIAIKFFTSIDIFSFNIFIDNLSAFFIFVISLLSLIVSLYSFDYVKHYYGKRNISLLGFLFNLFIISMIMVVSAGHLFFFLIVWELMSLISYFLVVFENEKPETQKAGILYVIMTHIGTAFIIAAFVLIYKYSGNADFTSMDPNKIPGNIKSLILIFALVGFGTKAGIVPLHVWLPSAHPAAPSHVSALMSGVMIKTAIYGILRVTFGFMGGAELKFGTIILVVGAASTIIGISYALIENNIKRLLAYSSVENIGIILIGIGLAVIARSKGDNFIAALAITASLFHVLNHSIFKGLLFMGAGSIHYSTGTKDIEKLGGLIKKMPYTAVFFLTGALAISAIPPFNGFVSEWLTYQSLFMNISMVENWIKVIIIIVAALLAMAGALVAYSLVRAFGISFLALPRTKNASEALEVPKSMLFGMGSLAVLCAVIGIFPMLIIKLIDNINNELFGTAISNSITGFSSFILYPVKLKSVEISPLAALLVISIILIFIYYINTAVKRKTAVREYGTWDCGYVKLNSRMEYSATGFSKPIRIVFRGIFKPQRELKVEEGDSPYFRKSAKYIVSTQSIFDNYIYKPLVKNIVNFSRRMRLVIQTGSVHTYLIYIFVVIIGMFIYFVKA